MVSEPDTVCSRIYPIATVRDGPNHNVASSSERYLRLHLIPPFRQILLLTAQTLRTLTVVVRTELISGILEYIAYTAMPNLTDLTLIFNSTRIAVLLEPAPSNTSRANLRRLRHLHIDTCHMFSSSRASSRAPRCELDVPRLATPRHRRHAHVRRRVCARAHALSPPATRPVRLSIA